MLALFIAGFVACALLLATERLARRSPVFSAGRILAAATVGSAVTLGIAYWLYPTGPTTDIPSVAVLPCDYEGIEDHAFLGPAAAEEVHAKLAKVAGVQIPAWRSVRKSAQVGEDKRQIAEILTRLAHVLADPARQAGRVEAMLEARQEQQLFAQLHAANKHDPPQGTAAR